MSRVSIVKCDTYELTQLKEHISKSCNLVGGLNNFIKSGDRVLIKPNFLSAKKIESAVTTHPNFIAAVCELLSDIGVSSIIIGDSPGIGTSHGVAKRLNLFPLVQKYNAQIITFDESKIVKGRGLFKQFEISTIVDSVDKIINLPKVKTHSQLYLTAAVKNNFGFVVGKKKPEWHFRLGFDFDYFAKMICELALLINPTITICDGVIAMEGNGPSAGTSRKLGLILAGSDPFSIDFILSKILDLDNEKNLVLKVARELKIIEENSIDVVGDPVNTINFKPPPTILSTTWGIPEPAKRILKRSLTSRLYIENKSCTLCKICQNHCPANAISLKNGHLKIDQGKCIRCFCCHEFCPESSISIKKGVLLKIVSLIKR